jgi:hypothetical protein
LEGAANTCWHYIRKKTSIKWAYCAEPFEYLPAYGRRRNARRTFVKK